MYAFVLEREVDVDLEMIRAEVSRTAVTENIFSPPEVETLGACRSSISAGVLQLLDAQGGLRESARPGIVDRLKSFDVSIRSGEPAEDAP